MPAACTNGIAQNQRKTSDSLDAVHPAARGSAELAGTDCMQFRQFAFCLGIVCANTGVGIEIVCMVSPVEGPHW